jgi:hypothetical protein
MKPLAVILLFLGFVSYVRASVQAGPWQLIMNWYAYRIMIENYGVDENYWIAAGCRGSGPDGSCLFNELVDYYRSTDRQGPFPPDLIGDNLTPDPVATVEKILDSAFDSGQASITDPTKFLPLAYPVVDEYTEKGYAPQLRIMNEYIAQARYYMKTSRGMSQESIDNSRNFANLKESILGVTDMRKIDNSDHTLDDMLKWMKDEYGVTGKTKVTTAVGGYMYLELDSLATIQSPENANVDTEFYLKKTELYWKHVDSDSARHWQVITALEKWTSDLRIDIPCSMP